MYITNSIHRKAELLAEKYIYIKEDRTTDVYNGPLLMKLIILAKNIHKVKLIRITPIYPKSA